MLPDLFRNRVTTARLNLRGTNVDVRDDLSKSNAFVQTLRLDRILELVSAVWFRAVIALSPILTVKNYNYD
jgi:hypothetical protein